MVMTDTYCPQILVHTTWKYSKQKGEYIYLQDDERQKNNMNLVYLVFHQFLIDFIVR